MRRHYHLIGIGGIGMSGIAQLLIQKKAKVSGSDLKESRIIGDLKGRGIEVFIGHRPENIRGADLIIYSSAIKEDNPELLAARREGIVVQKRAEALAELMKEKTVITVSGSHGKTTTASLASFLLLEAGFSPTIAVGGVLKNIDSNAYFGEGDFFVAEADESDGSFLHYRPEYSLITNIDREHLDYYKDFENELSAFEEFIARTKKNGCIIGCYDDANLKDMLKGCARRHIFFGMQPGADFYPKNIEFKGLTSEFDCFYKGRLISRFNLSLAGEHNISNSLAVIALGLELAIDTGTLERALANYKGSGRRLEVKFRDADFMIIDDYAHHPTEIKASLSALRGLGYDRVIAVFQPHRYTRTQLLLNEFSSCFDFADSLIITDIYAASEKPIAGVNARMIADGVRKRSPGKQVEFLPKEEITGHILRIVKPHDLVVVLGAGDIVKVSDELAEEFKGQAQARGTAQ